MHNVKSIWEGCGFTLRLLIFAFSLGLTTLVLLASTQSAHAIGLKENSVVTDNTITLGDIFYGLPHDSDKVLGSAPRPGSEMVLNARTLMRIAIALDLPWRPSSSTDYVVLRRAATLIDQEQIKISLKEELQKKGVKGLFDLKFSSAYADIILPQDQPASFEISNIKFDPKRDWFEATVIAPSKDNPIHRARISGSVERMTTIPVMRNTIRNGTTIGKRDIDFIDIPSRSLNHDMVIDAQELMGMTPRRMLMSGKPVKAGEIEAPQIVARGELVTMVFESGPLTLTAKGKALENGAKGDMIRVVNSGSNRTIEAVVTGSREVRVQSN